MKYRWIYMYILLLYIYIVILYIYIYIYIKESGYGEWKKFVKSQFFQLVSAVSIFM